MNATSLFADFDSVVNILVETTILCDFPTSPIKSYNGF